MRSWRRWRAERHPIAKDQPRPTPGMTQFMQTRELADCLRVAMGIMAEILEQMDWGQFETCDCGHRRIEHNLIAVGTNAGREPCGHENCACIDYDRIHQQVEEHIVEERLRAKAGRERELLKAAA